MYRCLAFTVGLVLFSGLCFSSASQSAWGATYNWSGTANWNTPGNWGGTVPGASDIGNISSGTATANVILTGGPTINVDGTGTLIHPAIAGTGALAGSINVGAGGNINFTGTSNDLTPTHFTNGSTFVRTPSNGVYTVNSPISITGTVTNTGNIGTVYESAYALTLAGQITGAGNLVVSPTLSTQKGVLRINPSAANPFTGTVTITGNSDVQATLALHGTGPLKNASAITINPYGVLRLNTATDPLKAGLNVPVVAGAKVEWGGTTTYTYADPDDIPKITFADGTTFGRIDSNTAATSREQIVIGTGVTVSADKIRGTVYESAYALTLAGSISGGGNLLINPSDPLYKATLQIRPTVANPFTGNVVVSGTPDVLGVLALGGTGALKNANSLTLNPNTILRFNTGTDALPAGTNLAVPSGSVVQWGGSSSYTYADPADIPILTFADGNSIGRIDQNAASTSREVLAIGSGTLNVDTVRGTLYESPYALTLAGPITGSGILNIDPVQQTLVTDPLYRAIVVVAPAAENPFTGAVVVSGTNNVKGALGVGGTGALKNISSLTLNPHSILRFNSGTDAFDENFNIAVNADVRVEWGGNSNYTYAQVDRPTITFADGTTFGRDDSNVGSTSRENLVLAPGATVSATNFKGTLLQQTYGVNFLGTLSGDDTTTLIVKPSTSATNIAVMHMNTAAANSFSGHVSLESVDSTYRGVLILNGTGPLGTATVNVGHDSILTVATNGALNNVTSVNVDATGSLRFRRTGGSTLDNTILTGTGLITSEITVATNQYQENDYTNQALTLTNTIVSPGNSAGTLTFDATVLTLGANSSLNIEIGASSDLLEVTGDLVLSPSSTLNLTGLPGMSAGEHIFATATGDITGQFGTVNALFYGPYTFDGIIYGDGFLAVSVGFVPEPGSGLLTGLGFLAMLVVRRKRRERA